MRILDVAEERAVVGTVRVVEWRPSTDEVVVRWLPPNDLFTKEWLIESQEEVDWPELSGGYGSKGEAMADLSQYLARVVDDDSDIPSLPRGIVTRPRAEVYAELEDAVRHRRLSPPSRRRYGFRGNGWDALDLTGDRARWDEVISYRSILRMVDGPVADDEELRDLAIAECANAMQTHPSSGLVWEAASRVSMMMGLLEQAHERALRACDLMPDYALASVQRTGGRVVSREAEQLV
ncbi:MAG: hypothetical protein U0353_09740 [Sandaracinus sp.]